MKKLIALMLTLAMVLSLVATATAEVLSADDIEDTMTAADGKYEVAFVTDVGQLKDKSFNQGTWEGCKIFASENGKSYKYYQPANGSEATDDDRYDAMKAACEGGAKVVVAAGFLQASALTKAAVEFPEVNFVFIDGWALTDANGNVLPNVAGVAYKEQQSGFLAGYAVVMEGFTKLGFCGGGGGTNPACCRYGYGFAQGVEAAAAAKGVNVELKYSWEYGASFSASAELQTMCNGWYEAGTEIIFACGGTMFSSITAAAAANDAAVVGVDVDQSFESETVVTSALKGLVSSVKWSLAKVFDGTFAEIGGQNTSLGAENDAVGLPTETWSLTGWDVASYEEMLGKIKAGEIVIDDSVLEAGAIAEVPFEHVTIQYV
ncbi:MAG: BMP family ABC transporter substrate-binding protein [Clostridia bacterium]|nr:BMP family ABC transporter substrate-binding protein [Clostridia bacterium]